MAEIITKTAEACPVCGGMTFVEHGVRDGVSNLFRHIEECAECGVHYPLVMYDCPECARVEKEREAQRLAGAPMLPGLGEGVSNV